ncbi:hypothetical protein [Rhodopirellula sp. MGV]|uniref:hypothetical protein n=1 Tax=Rhodopirellula sp. MGV TaxID=2023130 RepID=UPI000B977BBE|nr:hypothetical protein [Rhodopirellula sp. MGV]OYP33797.1 hypothetical protein CGZ80_17785 [Rhodopirellula sp. MGV]PNY37539.1 hypothetical protein C2E31_07360 [Rhodopirellula baltica]
MSRLDKQLDRLSGTEPVCIEWGADADLEQLRSLLVREIDRRTHRVPLDLRKVPDAPPELVELLVEMRRYALERSKILSMSWVLPPLRDAIERRIHQPIGTTVAPSADPDSEQASDRAKELLNVVEKRSEYDLSKAEKIERSNRVYRKKGLASHVVRYLAMSGLIIAGVAIISASYYFLTSEPPRILDRKTFEEVSESAVP